MNTTTKVMDMKTKMILGIAVRLSAGKRWKLSVQEKICRQKLLESMTQTKMKQ